MRNLLVKKKSFTLIELLVAMGILAFVITGLLSLFLNIMFLNVSSRNTTIAITHARNIFEDIRNAPFAGLQARINAGGANGWDLNSAQLQATYNLNPLPNETIATSSPSAVGADPMEVSVQILWRDRGLRNRSFELRSLITNF